MSSAPAVADLDADTVRTALRALGVEAPANARSAERALREAFGVHGAVRDLVDRAPEAARAAFVRLATEGPAAVDELLDRGWWGRGMLPPPLDWLQQRGLIAVGSDDLVHAVDEARRAFAALTLFASRHEFAAADDPPAGVRVEAARAVVVAPHASALDRALPVSGAGLRALTGTVAVSSKAPETVVAALRAAGVRLDDDVAVSARPGAPALPGASEDAVGPRAVRALFERAVIEARQLRLTYYASSRGGAATERTVDPWRFDEDLLVGYCHLREGERTFAVDRVGHARLLPSTLERAAP